MKDGNFNSSSNSSNNKKANNREERVLIAAVEGGGTSFVVAIAEIVSTSSSTATSQPTSFIPPKILHRIEVDSSHGSPQKTLQECAFFLRQHNPCHTDDGTDDGDDDDDDIEEGQPKRRRRGYHALGVAMFGPVGLNPNVPETYGRILPTTPKQSWRNVDVLSPLVAACQSSDDDNDLLVKIDTDVNAPAVAEFMAATLTSSTMSVPPITSVAYVTVGTGVGVGLVVNGRPVHGRMHPEGGHIPIQPLKTTSFDGYSWGKDAPLPFMGQHTVESMTSSVALTELLEKVSPSSTSQDKVDGGSGSSATSGSTSKTRQVLAEIDDDDHEIWSHAANALACLCVSLILTLSIEKIVLGGGVMKRRGLIDKIRQRTIYLMNGYVDLPPADSDEMKHFITTSSFGTDIGLIGAMVLAQSAIADDNETKQTTKRNKKNESSAFYVGAIHGVVVGVGIAALASRWIAWAAATATRTTLTTGVGVGNKQSK